MRSEGSNIIISKSTDLKICHNWELPGLNSQIIKCHNLKSQRIRNPNLNSQRIRNPNLTSQRITWSQRIKRSNLISKIKKRSISNLKETVSPHMYKKLEIKNQSYLHLPATQEARPSSISSPSASLLLVQSKWRSQQQLDYLTCSLIIDSWLSTQQLYDINNINNNHLWFWYEKWRTW